MRTCWITLTICVALLVSPFALSLLWDIHHAVLHNIVGLRDHRVAAMTTLLMLLEGACVTLFVFIYALVSLCCGPTHKQIKVSFYSCVRVHCKSP